MQDVAVEIEEKTGSERESGSRDSLVQSTSDSQEDIEYYEV